MEELYQMWKDESDFEKAGIFSKKISLDYKAKSNQPWLSLECVQNDRFSFQVHDLELGEKEAPYWQLAGQKKKEMKFEGFVNRLYNKGIGYLRGYLKVPEDNREIGIFVKEGRIIKLKSGEEIFENKVKFLSPILTNLESLITPEALLENKKESLIDKSDKYKNLI
ncbi:hypothetical protein KAJ87_02325 [Candidatus Pacearchaeota archaeon]|nr:hypothetical protein [Candidatus Pacearchaeota archaeon]